MTRVGINGLGRIGRLLTRRITEREDARASLTLAAANELADAETVAHLLKYDSTHGRFGSSVDVSDGAIHIAGKAISLTHEAAFGHDVWARENVALVIDCTGEELDRASAAQHLGVRSSAYSCRSRRVLMSTQPLYGGSINKPLPQTWPLSLRGRAPAMP